MIIFYNCSFFQQLLLRPPSDGLPTTTRIILGLIRSFILHTSIIYLFISEQILPLVESGGGVNSISCFIQQEQDGGDVTRAFLSSWSEYAGWILFEQIMRSIRSFFALRNHYGSRRQLLRGERSQVSRFRGPRTKRSIFVAGLYLSFTT